MSDAIALRALEFFTYCPRQCALILVDGVWQDNEHTVRGTVGHERVDTAASRVERGRRVIRGMELWHDELELFGRADAVEISGDGQICPVEYKIGHRHGVAADLQLCAQAMCLESMFGTSIAHGFIWYGATRRRHRVEFDDQCRVLTLASIDAIRDLFESRVLPSAPNDERCGQCQLLGHCLPDLASGSIDAQRFLAEEVFGCGR